MRLCMIGNSHLAALKMGWELEPSRQDVVATWFGSPRNSLADLSLHNGILRPSRAKVASYLEMTSGQSNGIVLSDYDAFVIVGCGLTFTAYASVYGKHRTLDQDRKPRPRHLISKHALHDFLRDLIERSLAVNLALKIRESTDTPIILIPSPLPARKIENDERVGKTWRALARSRDRLQILEDFDAAIEEKARSMGATVFKRVPDTCDGLIFSKNVMMDGRRIERPSEIAQHSDDDFAHMGPAYGRLVMQNLVQQVRR